MSKEFIVDGLAKNWYLVLVLIGIVAVAGVLSQGSDVVANANGQADIGSDSVDPALSSAVVARSRWQQPTRDSRVLDAIANYEEELKYNRGSSETPVNLYNLANLYYSKMQDYNKASLYYEALIQEHPDYKGLNTVYPNLGICYQRLGKYELERGVYRRMLDYFPDHTQEYLYAHTMLNG